MFKFKAASTLLALASIAFIIGSCTKSETVTTNKVDYAAVSKQIAESMYKSIAGEYGNASITKTMSASKTGDLKVNADTRCGTVIDSAKNHTYTVGGSTSTITGHFNFKYICDSWNAIGYALNDSTHALSTHADQDVLVIVNQKYTVMQPNSATDGLHTNGTQKSSITVTGKIPAIKSYHQDNEFELHDVIVKVPLGAISTGHADFKIKGNNEDGEYTYTGNLHFTSEYVVKVIFSTGPTYEVNLLTGTTTKL